MQGSIKQFFKEIGNIYKISADEVEDIFYELLEEHLEENNILIDDNKLYVKGVNYEHFNPAEIRKFRTELQNRVEKYAILQWKQYFRVYLNNFTHINGILEKEGRKYYYFIPIIEEEPNKILKIQVPKTNVRLNFEKEKGNVFALYFSKQVKIFRKNKPFYFNKLFTAANIITRQSVRDIIDKEIVSAFKKVYSIDDFKIKYISPINPKYGIINLIIKKEISANLLQYLENTFKRYGYIVSIKKKKEKNV